MMGADCSCCGKRDQQHLIEIDENGNQKASSIVKEDDTAETNKQPAFQKKKSFISLEKQQSIRKQQTANMKDNIEEDFLEDEENKEAEEEEEDTGPRKIERTNMIDIIVEDDEKVINGFLRLGNTIGSGAFCKVKRAVATFGPEEDGGESVVETYAVKIYNKADLRKHYCPSLDSDGPLSLKTSLDQVYGEISVWEKLSNKNIVKIYELLDDPSHDSMYLIMEFADMGTLLSWVEKDTNFTRNDELYKKAWDTAEMRYVDLPYSDLEKVTKFIFRQVADGLRYLHEEVKVVHRDLKPENILYSEQDDRVMIGDYTVAMELPNEEQLIRGQQGTLAFIAPECYMQEAFLPKPLDIWAFGVTLYAYLTLRIPFLGENEAEVKNKICHEQPEFPENISDDLRDLLSKLFEKDPLKRITILEMLEHKWMQETTEEVDLNNF